MINKRVGIVSLTSASVEVQKGVPFNPGIGGIEASRPYSSSRRMYVCSYRVNRRKRLARLGQVDALTLDQARKKAATYLGKVASNEDPQNQTDQLRTAQTIKQLVEAYIEKHAEPKKRSWKNDKSCLERLLLPKSVRALQPRSHRRKHMQCLDA